MRRTWVVVCDSANARLFNLVAPAAALEEIAVFSHPESRLKNQDLDSDRGGRSFDSRGKGRHAMEQHTDSHTREALEFAAEVVRHLETGRERGAFERLAIVAPPEFLGELRKEMRRPLRDLVEIEIAKDLVRHSVEDIRQALADHL